MYIYARIPSEVLSPGDAEVSKILDSVRITSVMSSPVIAIPLDRTVTEAAEMMQRHSISGLPVLNKDG